MPGIVQSSESGTTHYTNSNGATIYWQCLRQHSVKRASGPSNTISSHRLFTTQYQYIITLAARCHTQHILYKLQHIASLSDFRMTFSRWGFTFPQHYIHIYIQPISHGAYRTQHFNFSTWGHNVMTHC